MIPAWMKDLEPLCLCRHDFQKTGLTWGLFLSPESLLSTVQSLYHEEFFLEDISTLDAREGFVIVYHLSAYQGPERVALHVILPHHEPQIPSISTVYSGALWHERETTDFFGIRFAGHPDPKPLLLPEGMTDHPLQRKEKDRAPFRDLLDTGEILKREPDLLFFEKNEEPVVKGKPETH
ncbi:respiratory-chain NADH dehydrogenase, 30 Kd subunit [delta proteobacterium NaphS2]|nr:respiratory-chain NADH dehydrogenase, 30 Kd subunit [delta proteobacterium NaphS2]